MAPANPFLPPTSWLIATVLGVTDYSTLDRYTAARASGSAAPSHKASSTPSHDWLLSSFAAERPSQRRPASAHATSTTQRARLVLRRGNSPRA